MIKRITSFLYLLLLVLPVLLTSNTKNIFILLKKEGMMTLMQSYTRDNPEIVKMLLFLLIIAVVMNILLILLHCFRKHSIISSFIRNIITWGPIIFSIIYIITPINVIGVAFEDIVFLIWAIGNSIHRIMFKKVDVHIEIIKWVTLGIGLFIALTDNGIIIKSIFIIVLILGIIILIIIGLFGFVSKWMTQQKPETHFYCEYCGTELSSLEDLISNKCFNHPKGRGNHKLYEGIGKSSYICKYCGSSYKTLLTLTHNDCMKHPHGENMGKCSPDL